MGFPITVKRHRTAHVLTSRDAAAISRRKSHSKGHCLRSPRGSGGSPCKATTGRRQATRTGAQCTADPQGMPSEGSVTCLLHQEEQTRVHGQSHSTCHRPPAQGCPHATVCSPGRHLRTRQPRGALGPRQQVLALVGLGLGFLACKVSGWDQVTSARSAGPQQRTIKGGLLTHKPGPQLSVRSRETQRSKRGPGALKSVRPNEGAVQLPRVPHS